MVKKLSKTLIKKYFISYAEAVRLGITNEDLKYIIPKSPTSYRVSVPNSYGKRKTKVEHNLVDAIHRKYDFIADIDEEERKAKSTEEKLLDARSDVTKYDTVYKGLQQYMKERYYDKERGYIQESTYDQDIVDVEKASYIKDSKILDELIVDVDSRRAQLFVNYLFDLTNNSGEKLSENTIYKPFSFIRKLFNYFKNDLEIIDINPFDRIKNKPKVVSKPKDYFNEDEMHYIHDMVEFENIRFRTLIVLMMDTGMRREESLAIKYSDINIIRKTLSISRAFVYLKANGQAIVKPTKTASSVREIFLTNHAMELIQNMRKFKEACGFIVNDDDYVFTAWDSMELVNPNGFSREFKAFLEKIGMKKIIPLKNLRTTNTTFYIARGQNIKAVQKHAGHSSFDTTMTFYAQSDLSEDRKLTNIYEEEFYNKLGLSVSDIYRIISNRFDDHKKLTSVLEKLTGEYIDSSNFDIQLERCQEYFTDLFPIFDKILKIDNLLNDDDIDCLFEGYKSRYLSIKIEPLPPMPKL